VSATLFSRDAKCLQHVAAIHDERQQESLQRKCGKLGDWSEAQALKTCLDNVPDFVNNLASGISRRANHSMHFFDFVWNGRAYRGSSYVAATCRTADERQRDTVHALTV